MACPTLACSLVHMQRVFSCYLLQQYTRNFSAAACDRSPCSLQKLCGFVSIQSQTCLVFLCLQGLEMGLLWIRSLWGWQQLSSLSSASWTTHAAPIPACRSVGQLPLSGRHSQSQVAKRFCIAMVRPNSVFLSRHRHHSPHLTMLMAIYIITLI